MEELIKYIKEAINVDLEINKFEKSDFDKLPMFIESLYVLYSTELFNQQLILIKYKNEEDFSIKQAKIHFEMIRNVKQRKVVLVLDKLNSIMRKRLVEKGINFIVPNKQLFLPELLIQLQESFSTIKPKGETQKLLPLAQLILLYHFLHREVMIEQFSFKQLAQKFQYTQMAISKAVENLKQLSLITVTGEKEKSIRFTLARTELWHEIETRNLFVNPVFKSVYVDEIPRNVKLLQSYTSALPEYSDVNPSNQQYFAIEKALFYQLEKENGFVNINPTEGIYCLEVWKYDPAKLADNMEDSKQAVDPLSLYLCLRNSVDERIEIALEQLLKTYLW